MNKNKFPQTFLDKLQSVKNKRAKVVIDHILQHGSINTDEIADIYGYKHPPRAAKDIRDEGIPLETFYIKSKDGRRIAAYQFGDPSKIIKGRFGGRTAFSKKFKTSLYKDCDGRCRICNGRFEIRELQIDHRIPYEIAGDSDHSEADFHAYMLVCGSCNRAKSWSCEHCPNWNLKMRNTCGNCYWAFPLSYSHVATKDIRRTDILWEGTQDVDIYRKIQALAKQSDESISEYIKSLLKDIESKIIIE